MDAWEARRSVARAGLAPALLLLGEWAGEGLAHGEPVQATLRVRAVLDGTQIEVWERVGEHEDVCYYRFDVGTGQIRVLHLMAPAMVAEYAVEVALGAIEWVTPPNVPGVVCSADGDGLLTEVWWPDAKAPEVRIRYRRV